MNDIERGRVALSYFHNASLGFSVYPAKTIDDLLLLYGKKSSIYLEGIGLAINSVGLDESKVKSSMLGLANRSKGQVPKDHQAYIKALGDTAAKIDYLDLSTTVAKDVAVAAADGAQKVGSSVLTTLSWLTTLLPYLVIGGIIFYIYSFGKNNSTISKETRDQIKSKVREASAKLKSKIKKAKT